MDKDIFNAEIFIDTISIHFKELDSSIVKHNLKTLKDSIESIAVCFVQGDADGKAVNRLIYDKNDNGYHLQYPGSSKAITSNIDLNDAVKALKELQFHLIDPVMVRFNVRK
jgi:hypothetical protein